MDIHLGSGSKLDAAAFVAAGKKRKRVVDEDADSAAGSGDEAEESYEEVKMPVSALESLTKDLKEVYTVLQKSTARGRLLAEQVCLISDHSGSTQLMVYSCSVPLSQSFIRTHMLTYHQVRLSESAFCCVLHHPRHHLRPRPLQTPHPAPY